MGLFSKLKDYNTELEEILEAKYFSSNIKSLLFSMMYKLEISYKDFKEVKRCVRSKEDFLNEIVEVIRLYCDNIKTVEPDSDQAKMLIKNNVKAVTNEKERSILAYPTEQALLYAISDISPKYFFINTEFSLKKEIQNSLVNGYIQNNMEILTDFTGWSWDKTFEKKYYYIDNLIYQNLLVILGEKFLYEWRNYGSTRTDFLEQARKYIKIFTGNEKYLMNIYKLIYLNSSQKEKLKQDLKQDNKLLKKMTDKDLYFFNDLICLLVSSFEFAFIYCFSKSFESSKTNSNFSSFFSIFSFCFFSSAKYKSLSFIFFRSLISSFKSCFNFSFCDEFK